MKTQLLITAGIFGACMGSFLNVVAQRSIQGKSWWGKERSICESCGHVLEFYELIPVISWLFLRGRCKNCGAKISVRYILIELICAAMALMIFSRWGISWACLIIFVGSCSMVVNSLTDFESGDVFDVFAISPGIIALIIRLAGGKAAFFDGLEGALIGWGIFALIIIISHGGMGWGDATFMCGMGAVLGLKFTCLAFYIGIMFGGFWVIALMLIGKIKWGKGQSVPLVPFLAVGCFIAMVYGAEIFAYISQRLIHPEIFTSSWPFIMH